MQSAAFYTFSHILSRQYNVNALECTSRFSEFLMDDKQSSCCGASGLDHGSVLINRART